MAKRVGKYDMGRTLGEGTFGKVKYAVNIETGEAVAIKVLDKEKIQKQNMGNQIKREISIMKMVKHKYVTEMIEVLASKTKIFIVLELVNGGELFDKIVKEGKMSEDQALFYFNQLVEGVEYCHQQGVCHRDLKPENLLLDEHGDLKISDFGLSSLYVGDADSDGAARTQILHTTCGTPNYVAPEVLADKGYDGKKADVWSIGVILYVLLAGFLPFDETTIIDLFEKIQLGVYSVPTWFSENARSVIGQMLVKDPKQRITLSKLREHPWLRSHRGYVDREGQQHGIIGGGGHQRLEPGSSEFGSVEESAGATGSADAKIEEEDDDDWNVEGQTTSRAPRSLNAFELVSQVGGFCVDRFFSPHIYANINETVAGQHGDELSGNLRFGAVQKNDHRFNFSSRVTPVENLISEVFGALANLGCEMEVTLERALTNGIIRASKLTPKGSITIVIRGFSVCTSLCLLEIRRGKGDILEWNHLYQTLLQKIGHLLNVPNEGEAKMESAR